MFKLISVYILMTIYASVMMDSLECGKNVGNYYHAFIYLSKIVLLCLHSDFNRHVNAMMDMQE